MERDLFEKPVSTFPVNSASTRRAGFAQFNRVSMSQLALSDISLRCRIWSLSGHRCGHRISRTNELRFMSTRPCSLFTPVGDFHFDVRSANSSSNDSRSFTFAAMTQYPLNRYYARMCGRFTRHCTWKLQGGQNASTVLWGGFYPSPRSSSDTDACRCLVC